MRSFSHEEKSSDSEVLLPGLYIVSTPIGNLGDITLRALSVLSNVDTIYAEDTRRSRILLNHFKIETPLQSYHEHNAHRQRPKILKQITSGKTIAIVSDSGTPLISDPGYKLAQEAINAGHALFPIPGPSSFLTALVVSGLPTDTFMFVGFLPKKDS